MEEHTKQPEEEKGVGFVFPPLTTPRAIMWNAVIIGAAIIIAGFVVAHGPFTGGSLGTTTPVAEETSKKPDIASVTLIGAPYIGNINATSAIAYWSDFQCPYCKQFETTTFQKIIKDYVTPGKVTIVFKDFAFLGPDSTTAALYSRAVWQLYPEKYFAWREAMYNAQDAENGGFGDEPSVKNLTGTIAGIDADKVASAVKDNKDDYQSLIDADREEALKFGIQGTPSFITGKTLIPGVAKYETFKKELDAQLK